MSVLSYTQKPLFTSGGHAVIPNNITATSQGWMVPMSGVQRSHVASVSWTSNVATITTVSNHNFVNGQHVFLTGLIPVAYNGLVTLTAITSNSFSYALASDPGALTTIATTGFAWATRRNEVGVIVNGVVTVTTASAHDLVSGQYVMLAGVTPTAYNGNYEVVVIDATHFTYNLVGATTPGTVTIEGTIQTVGIAGITGEILAPIGGLDIVVKDLLVTPTISSVTSTPSGTATINTASTITLNVTWSEAVQVIGLPYINITIGSNVRKAMYATGSGTTTWTFVYTVVAGDTGTGATPATAISLVGDEYLLDISPASGNNAGNHSQAFASPTFSAPDLSGITWN